MTIMKHLLFDELTPVALYAKIKEIFTGEITMLFESVVNSNEGNFSFITIGTQERLQYIDNQTLYTLDDTQQTIEQNPFEFLQSYYAKLDPKLYKTKALEHGFGFVDGFIGFIGYDMVKVFEPTLKPHMDALEDTLHTPDMDLIRPKIIIAYSHKSAKLTIIENHPSLQDKLARFKESLSQPYTPQPLKPIKLEQDGSFAIDEERFKAIIEESKESIKAGDVFQILISNRYTQHGSIDPLTFYRALRAKNPSPYLFLLDFENFSICGSSPEVMVKLDDGDILLRPIAGTRKRGKTHHRDKELEEEMLNDPKECAEHLMLVDLGRNDVGRVAKVGSVKVTQMMRVERYSHVMHMVSDIQAQIQEGKDMFDLFRATFTAGTMTGAPKIKAMELISHFEKLKRGFYSGSVAYFSFTGDMDSAITIRTALIQPNSITLQAGAGVVADSKPVLEYLEVKNKLNALLETIAQLQEV
ncbi:MAG: anthranilate synthase [Sulfurovum sp. FS08-3]|nr:MAG: anthranilate synthase [Sulfurovum sp. FS08-3]